MSAPVTELLGPDVVRSIADDVWTALLDEEVVEVLRGQPQADAVAAQVTVHGPWNGVVVLSCAAATAHELAVRMNRARPLPQVGPEDVEDALGELANVLGGNVKALLPGPSTLGLPLVGALPAPAVAADTCRVDLLWRRQPLTITVQGVPAPDAAPAPLPTTLPTPLADPLADPLKDEVPL